MGQLDQQTIPDLVQQAATRFGPSQALVDGDIDWSFDDLSSHVQQMARALIANGVEHGERVGIWAPNTWEWVVAALGVHEVGAVLVPINTRFKGKEASYVLSRANVKRLFTVTDFLDINYVDLLESTNDLNSLNQIIVMRGQTQSGTISMAEFLESSKQTEDATYQKRRENVSGEDLCHIMFTSGTTGLPKGAMLTHAAVTRGYNDWADIVGLQAGDRYLIVNPFFHSFGLNAGILACLMKGACILPHPVFDVAAVMDRVPIDKISMLPGPPAIYQTILNHPDLEKFDMSTLRLAVTGAAVIPVEMIVQMREKLGFEKFVTG